MNASDNAAVGIDNTLATPYLIRPLDHGADIIVHSATKYLGGHGNSMGGAIVDCGTFEWMDDARYPMLSAPRPEYSGMILAETFGNFAFAIACRVLSLRDLGPAISPFNAFLILNGIETLALRMQRHCDNALAVARHLQAHAKVGWVNFAGPAKLIGRFVDVSVTEALAHSLRGRLPTLAAARHEGAPLAAASG